MLISLEGLDGSGKTTVWNGLNEVYDSAVFTREPTRDTFYGDAVLDSLSRDDSDPLAELFLYMADHAAHLSETVKPALEEGGLVITDRYSDSRFAYQAVSLDDRFDDSLAYVRQLHDRFTVEPDVTVFIEVDPKVAVERSDEANKFEKIDYLEEVQSKYERIMESERDRFRIVDGEQDREAVLSDVVDIIEAERANNT